MNLGGGAEEEEEEEEGGRKERVEWRSFSRRVIREEREDLIWALCASISISFASASSFSFSTLRGSNPFAQVSKKAVCVAVHAWGASGV